MAGRYQMVEDTTTNLSIFIASYYIGSSYHLHSYLKTLFLCGP